MIIHLMINICWKLKSRFFYISSNVFPRRMMRRMILLTPDLEGKKAIFKNKRVRKFQWRESKIWFMALIWFKLYNKNMGRILELQTWPDMDMISWSGAKWHINFKRVRNISASSAAADQQREDTKTMIRMGLEHFCLAKKWFQSMYLGLT